MSDIRPQPWLTAPHYVYELYTVDDCFYVGVTLDLPRRMREHVASWYWPHIERLEVTRHPDQKSGRDAERERIQRLTPIFNCAHADHPAGYERWKTRDRLSVLPTHRGSRQDRLADYGEPPANRFSQTRPAPAVTDPFSDASGRATPL